MSNVSLKQLVGKLNDTCRRSLEAAAGLCLSRTNYNVEVEHWLHKLIELPNSDFGSILRHFDVDAARLSADLTRTIDRFKTGNSRSPALSPSLVTLIREAWLVASIDFSATTTRSGHILCALLNEESLHRIAEGASSELSKISLEALRSQFSLLVNDTDEAAEAGASSVAGEAPGVRASGPTQTPSLDQYTIDLTARARAGEIDPVRGRDAEIRQVVDILTRRRQNNPILTGEAGVGKTAVVEGFAQRLVAGDVTPALRNVAIRTLDLGLLQAGAGVRGEFENRLKSVINEVKASPTPVILFIDEAHTLIGAGGGGGQGDAANLLKPALARGELRTIAATTWAEYKKYFEKDAALARRFQVVKIEEPPEAIAVEMIQGLSQTLEKHHGVLIRHDALVDAVKLSSRYISGRQLPDKAVSLLDTTCARIGLSQTATPPAVEDCERRIEQLDLAIGILEREAAIGTDHKEPLAELRQNKLDAEAEMQRLQERWQAEKELVTSIQTLRSELGTRSAADVLEPSAKIETPTAPVKRDATNTGIAAGEPEPEPLDNEQIRQRLHRAEVQLQELQGETPLVFPEVNSHAVAQTVASWTGIPVGRMLSDEIKTILHLETRMEESIVGQDHALQRIAQAIRTSRANMSDPRTPIGVFMMVGMSGVGKTETAVTLANLLYGGEQNMTVINMSEFKEEHKVSLLMGSPPGYVGYGEGGGLTEAVRRRPYSVVLLDEMEKAHSGVQDVFYQVFDKGTMKDGEGRDIDFKNTVIIMTTNAATDFIKDLCADPELWPDPDGFVSAVFPELLKTFKPAFLGRVTIVPYYPLPDDVMRKIIALKLSKIANRVHENYRAEFVYEPEVVDTIAQRCTEVETGARNVDHILTRTLLPELAAEFLGCLSVGKPVRGIRVSADEGGRFLYEIN
jgi:type VI secretion system protein VasG